MNSTIESKKLAIELRAKEDDYVTGELDLNQALDKTQRLWREMQKKTQTDENVLTANEILPDSNLMKIQTGLAKRSARFYKPDALVFNPVEFSKKVRMHYDQSSQNDSISSTSGESQLWLELGSKARKVLHTVPFFNFIHGTFDPDPVEVVKKKRKMKEKDKVGDLTKPLSMSLDENKDDKDQMVAKAERVLGILNELLKKNRVVCFYEFVTDPSSFGRTVENAFIVSLLVNQNCGVKILKDKKGLPCLSSVNDDDKRNRNPASMRQQILTIDHKKWKDVVNTFKFKNALITPQKPSPKKRMAKKVKL